MNFCTLTINNKGGNCEMTTVTISGLVFYVFVVIFSNSINTAQVSRIQSYYRKENTIVKIQSNDCY